MRVSKMSAVDEARGADHLVRNSNISIVPKRSHVGEPQQSGGSPYVIQVVDVSYTYEKPSKDLYVLKNLSFDVSRGQIYALLGPSGCGKTTILKCITGSLVPRKGTINIPSNSTKFKVPGKGVGYMPQELSLFPNLTIQETLWLFGRVNGIEAHILQGEINKWSAKFGLPTGQRLVRNLSGGQQRRVSLICAFLHDAPIIILDEPTVGLDPLLRKTIWEFMVDLTTTKKRTILLTTHYIEEAKDAHMVGLMREGRMLAQSSTSDLLTQFNESSLEKCFYRICVKGDTENEANVARDTENPESKLLMVRSYEKESSCKTSPEELHDGSKDTTKMGSSSTVAETLVSSSALESNVKFVTKNVIPALLLKNWNVLRRSRFLFFLQFALPSIIVFACGMCIGGKVHGLSIAVVNDEKLLDLSLVLLKSLSAHPIRQYPFSDMNSAIDTVKIGRNILVLQIPEDFTTCFRNRVELGVYTPPETVKCASVYLHQDTTNQVISLDVQNTIIATFERFEMDFIRNYSDASPSVSALPLRFEEPIYGNKDMKFSEYITSSVLLTCSHFLATALTGINLILERQSGVLDRFEVCGVTKTQVFIAQLLTNVVVVVFQVSFMLITQFTLFSTVVYGSFVLAVTLIILQGLCGMLFGLFISAVAVDITTGILGGMGVLLPNIILSGFMWPIEGMPQVLRKLSHFIPVTQTNEALRSIILRGWGLDYFQVQMGVLSVVLWSAIFLTTSMFIFRIKK